MGTCFGRHSRDYYDSYGGGYYGGQYRSGDYLHDRHGQSIYADQVPVVYRDDSYYDRPYAYYPETTLYADDLRYTQPVQAIRYSPRRPYDRDGFY